VVGALATVLPDRPAPGAIWGDYPQRDEDRERGLRHALLGRVRGLLAGAARATAILGRADALAATKQPLPARAAALRARAASAGGGRRAEADALGLACVAARRELGLDPYASQVRTAAIMLDEGLAELATGEGKTLALALAAAARAIAGVPVHVVTVNDYLVERDAAALEPFFRTLGLTVDRVLAADAPERRRRAWRADVVYCTAHELMFDYLRDRLAGADRADLGALAASMRPGTARAGDAPLLRGLCSALLDEADGLLVDEATLPCILAQPDAEAGEGAASADGAPSPPRAPRRRRWSATRHARNWRSAAANRSASDRWRPATRSTRRRARRRSAARARCNLPASPAL
jgi:preprotein translocase subunit SecA